MLKGTLIGGSVVLSDSGKPIVEVDAPEAPEGYEMRAAWREDGSRIVQAWEAVPVAGSVDDAVRTLAMMQAERLSDDDALKVVPLYKEWVPGLDYYDGTDPEHPQSRRTWKGILYKCTDKHTALTTWEPDVSPSLWERVLPGQEGNDDPEVIEEWVQPDSTNGYSKGDQVSHNGHAWQSDVDDNVWEPGTVGAPWTDIGEIE